MSKNDDPRNVLAAVSAAESRLAECLKWPFWRHAVVGGVMGLIVFAQTLEGTLSLMASFSAALVAIIVTRNGKSRDGFSIQVFGNKRLVLIGIGLVAICVAAVIAVRSMEGPRIEQPIFWLITFCTVIFSTALSFVRQKLYMAELRRGRHER